MHKMVVHSVLFSAMAIAMAISAERVMEPQNGQWTESSDMEKYHTLTKGESIKGISAVEANSLPVFDIHFCVITKNQKAQESATLRQLQKEVEILNKYFVTEKREAIIRFRFKSAHFYKDVTALKCDFVALGDGGVPYDSNGWARIFNQCPHKQVRDPQAINFYIYDSYGRAGAADQTSHGKRNSNRPYVLIDWQRLNHRTQSPEEHEMGHAFGLEHICIPGATTRSHTNIMATAHAGSSGGLKDLGFTPEQVKVILHHAAITYKKLYGRSLPALHE
jgi:hypothetical protein